MRTLTPDKTMSEPLPSAAAAVPASHEDRFVEAHLTRIFRQIYRMVGNVHDAQDLTQEVFIKALQRREQIRDAEKAAHWLSRIATNTALDFLRRAKRVSFTDIADAPAAAFASKAFHSPESRMLRHEQRDWLAEGLDRLTPRERAALVLRDMEDLPAAEVAKRLDCSGATVRSHIANARVKFRKFVERRQR
jgi:RNA polymerase sigma-70 factor (ECF subfamily)